MINFKKIPKIKNMCTAAYVRSHGMDIPTRVSDNTRRLRGLPKKQKTEVGQAFVPAGGVQPVGAVSCLTRTPPPHVLLCSGLLKNPPKANEKTETGI
ncbi:hypothetical protein ACLOJK_024112 [Asimina triloba]